jgi:hypothetical protein
VNSAFEAPRGFFTELGTQIQHKFAWERSAHALLLVYKKVTQMHD